MLIPSNLPHFIGTNFYNEPKTYLYNNAIYTCCIGYNDNIHGVFSQDGHLITSAAFFYKYPAEMKSHPISVNPNVAKNFPMIEEAFFAGHCHDQYGHFLTEFISRIWAYKQQNLKMPILVKTVNKTLDSLLSTRWAKDLLDLLDLKRSDFISPNTPIRIKNLIVPDPLYAEQGFCYKHMADFCHTLGDKAMESLSEDTLIKNSNIYVSRSKLPCGTIRVDNEHILEEKLKELGFIIIHPQDYLVREQISFFRNNNIVVGIVGSAFHTSIFSPSPQGVAVNMKEYPDINYLTMDGAHNASIDYVIHDGIVNSPRPNGNYYHTKTIKDPEKFANDLHTFVNKKRNVFSIANMGRNSVAYKPDITFSKIKCKQEEKENIVKVDTRTGLITTKEGEAFNDLLLVTLKTKNQPNQNFLIVNSDTPSTIKHHLIAAPILPVTIDEHEDKISIYIKNIDRYFVTSNNDKVAFETYSVSDFDYSQEHKDGLKLLCSILSSVLDTDSHSNMEYYINIYPDLVNSIFEIKNSLHRDIRLTYGNTADGFIPLSIQEPEKFLNATIVTHRGGIGDIIVKGSIDTGKSYVSSIEAIHIKLNAQSKNYTIKYSVLSKGGKWTEWLSEGKIAGTKGQNKPIIGFSAKIFDHNQKEIPCVCNAQFANDDTVHSYDGGVLFSSPDDEKLIGFAVYLA